MDQAELNDFSTYFKTTQLHKGSNVKHKNELLISQCLQKSKVRDSICGQVSQEEKLEEIDDEELANYAEAKIRLLREQVRPNY